MNKRLNIFSLSFCTTLLLVLFQPSAFSQKTWKLDVVGNVRDEDSKEAMKGAKIEITKGGLPFKTLYADDNGNFSYSLEPDNTYTVKVSISSYVSKIITISTDNTPTDQEVKQNFSAKTEFRIFKRVPDIDYSVLDSPIGAIFFDPVENKFDYSVVDFDLKRKLEELKKEMEKKKAEQEALEKAEKEAALKRIAYTKDSTLKADADAKKKAAMEADEAKKKAAADAKLEADAKKKAAAEAEVSKKKAAADAEALKVEEKKKILLAAELAKTEAKQKTEKEELEKAEAKKNAELIELEKKKSAEKIAALEAEEKLAAKKKASEDALKKEEIKAVPAPVVKSEPPPVRIAPEVKKIESAPPEIIQPENVRYDEFDFGTYHVNRTFITTGGVEYEFQKIQHKWGGIFYKRDGLDLTEGTYKKELRKYGLKP